MTRDVAPYTLVGGAPARFIRERSCDLTYRLGPRILFDKATVALPASGRIGFVGRNGTGKTTFMNTLAGATRQHEGSIWLAGVALPLETLNAVTGRTAKIFKR